MGKQFLLCCIISLCILSCAALSYALGDGSSCSTDMPAAAGLANLQEESVGSIIATAGFDYLYERELDDEETAISGETEAGWGLLGLGYRINNKYEPYLRIGAANMDASWNQSGSKITMDGEHSFAIGAGLKMLAYKTRITSLLQLKLNLEGQLRYASPSIDKITIGTTEISRSVSAKELEVFEGRVAATVAFEISLKKLALDEEEVIDFYLVPYIGAGYTSSIVTAKFDYSGASYGYDGASQDSFGLIGGLDIVAPEYVLFNMEGQLFDNDRSVSGGVNIKF